MKQSTKSVFISCRLFNVHTIVYVWVQTVCEIFSAFCIVHMTGSKEIQHRFCFLKNIADEMYAQIGGKNASE